MDALFQLPLLHQSIVFGLIVFVAVFVLITTVLHFTTFKETCQTVLSGTLSALIVSIAATSVIYFFNDDVYSAYLKNIIGPKYIAEAEALGATPDDTLTVIMDDTFAADIESNLKLIQAYKESTYLTPDQFNRFFEIFKTCHLNDFVRPDYGFRADTLSDIEMFAPAKAYPISHKEMASYFKDAENALEAKMSELHAITTYRNSPEYSNYGEDRLKELLKYQNYQPRHPLCFSGNEINYVLNGK